MLKAFFDETFRFDRVFRPVTPGGTALKRVEGLMLPVGGELNKLASNIAFGRGMGGVHWRSDNLAGLLLGEQIAIGLLKEQSLGFPEGIDGPRPSFQFTKFDGKTSVTIRNGECMPKACDDYSIEYDASGG
jgi:hypothetical protein